MEEGDIGGIVLASEFEEAVALLIPGLMGEEAVRFVDGDVFFGFLDDPCGIKLGEGIGFFFLGRIEDGDDITGFNFPTGDPDFFVVDLDLTGVEHGFDGGAGPSGLEGLDGFVDAFAVGGGGDGEFEGARFGHGEDSFWIYFLY